MLRTTLASSRVLRVSVLGLVTLTAAAVFTTGTADARHYRHRHHAYHAYHHYHARHHEERESYSPQFSSIIVDGNSGATLTASSPDASRHPASLTKIMTLYLLFERLDAGKMNLDTEMAVSEHASEQAPTKLGLRPGQTIRVEDAIKGLVTRSANDAAVVIAEAIAGDEDDFAKLMTHKARALGMTRTVYRNASGLPDDDQVTTARDQSTLGRSIQDRFPRYYRYFSTETFNYHGQSIRNHNHLLGSVEGVDGIKTGYTRSSGFNLVTSMRRGNRHLVGVVMGGRSGSSRDAIMRNLLAENLEKAASKRTVAAITERNPADANADVAEAEAASRPTQTVQVQGAVQAASEAPEPAAAPPARSTAQASRSSILAAAAAAVPPPQAKPEPAPFTNGVIQAQSIAAIPGSSEPMKPVKVKTVQIKAGQMKLAAAGAAQPATPITSAIPARPDVPETSSAIMAKAESNKAELTRLNPTRLTSPGPRCRRNRQTTAPETVCSGCCRHQVHRPPPLRRRWPMPIRRLTASRRPFSKTARSSRWQSTPDGSFRSARWKARAKHANVSKSRATRLAVCSARRIRLPNRSSPKASGSCSVPALPVSTAIRPRRYAGR